MKLYSNTSNCVRGAKTALGEGAQRDVHFTVTKTDATGDGTPESPSVPSQYHWAAIEGAPAVPEVAPKQKKTKAVKAVAVAIDDALDPDKTAGGDAAEANVALKGKSKAKPAAKGKSKAKPAVKAKKAPDAKVKAKSAGNGTIGHQDKSQFVLALVRREKGVTVKDGAARSGTASHSFRAVICRLDKEYRINKERVGGVVVYSGGTVVRRKPAAARAAAPVTTKDECTAIGEAAAAAA